MALTIEDITFSDNSARLRVPEAFTLVVFGASGDLARRKLIPAVFALHCQGLLPEDFAVLGFARTPMSDEEFRARVRDSLDGCKGEPVSPEQWEWFVSRLHYFSGQYDRAADYATLRDRLADGLPENRLFYLATPPESFVPVVRGLAGADLTRKGAAGAPWARVIVEKPFGRDLAGAQALNGEILSAFDERQVFRIDHYLGKETVQNLLVLRFANAIFEPLWNLKYVDHVQLTVAETIGVEGRGGTFDRAGILRDMVQNHLMQLLCLAAMEPPLTLSAEAIRDEKVRLLRSLRPQGPQCAASGVVRGQYAAGTIDGRSVPGYLQEPNVPADSQTETFVAFQAHIDNWRWAGVPFYLRTGKRLAKKVTEVSVHFRPVPQVLFNLPPVGPQAPNVLAIRIQPDEGISLAFQVKQPGPGLRSGTLKMDFSYAEAFGSAPPDAYQRLLLDAALGDPTLFTRNDEVEAAWRFITSILEGFESPLACRMLSYPAGSWGPPEADALLRADGARWHLREE